MASAPLTEPSVEETPEKRPEQSTPSPERQTAKPKESVKPKTTLNLGSIFKQPKSEAAAEKPKEIISDKSFTEDELREAWRKFAETRKNQLAEFHLLNRGYELKGTTLQILLANLVEEPLLSGMKTELTAFLREHVGNSNLQIVGQVQEISKGKMAYTNKEKFEAMAQQNPALLQLKERFGLDPDF